MNDDAMKAYIRQILQSEVAKLAQVQAPTVSLNAPQLPPPPASGSPIIQQPFRIPPSGSGSSNLKNFPSLMHFNSPASPSANQFASQGSESSSPTFAVSGPSGVPKYNQNYFLPLQKKPQKKKGERFPTFNRKVVLLPSPNVTVITKNQEDFLGSLNFVFHTVTFLKSSSPDDLEAKLKNLFPAIKSGTSFSLLTASGSKLSPIYLEPGVVLDGRILSRSTYKSIFIRPSQTLVTSSEEEIFESLGQGKVVHSKSKYSSTSSDEEFEWLRSRKTSEKNETTTSEKNETTTSEKNETTTSEKNETTNLQTSESIPTNITLEAEFNNEGVYLFQDESGVVHVLKDVNTGITTVDQSLSFESTALLFDNFKRKKSSELVTVEFKRSNLLNQTIEYLKTSKLTPLCNLRIKFEGENGIDLGGVRREFLTNLIDEIKCNDHLFQGWPETRQLKFNQSLVRKKIYFYVGQIFVLSLLNDGPGPKCFSSVFFKSLYTSLEDPDLVKENICDPHHLYALKLLESCDSFLNLNQTIAEHSLFSSAGIEQQSKDQSTLEEAKSDVFKDAITYLLTERVSTPLQQLKDGLEPFLPYVEANKELLLDVFMSTERRILTADIFQNLFIGYPLNDLENAMKNNWISFLKDCELDKCLVSLSEVLQFATGLKDLPPQGFHPKPTLSFNDPSSRSPEMPSASTCNNEISLPCIYDYSRFMTKMEEGIKGGNDYFEL